MKRILMIALAALSLVGAQFSKAAAPPHLKSGAGKALHQVLVASERSVFKDVLVDLADINATEWSAVVMVHTWESNLPPVAVSDFLARTSNAG